MWTIARTTAVWALSAAALLFGMGFAVTTPAKLPGYALVYVDEEHETFLAPQCVNAWREQGGASRLRRSNAGEARGLGYAPDARCERSGAFSPPGASLSRGALEHFGFMPAQKQWWDAPYRTEDGMVYPPSTHV